MLVFRGTKDIRPVELNHRNLSQGYYGAGTYYALSEDDARRYADGRKFKLITAYEIQVSKVLKLNNQNVLNLKHFLPDHELKLDEALQSDLGSPLQGSALCEAVGTKYDCILCEGEVEGGEQLIVPQQSSLSPVPQYYIAAVWIGSTELGQQFIGYMQSQGYEVKKSHGWYEFKVKASEIEFLDALLIFCGMCSNGFVDEVDFNKRTITEFEE